MQTDPVCGMQVDEQNAKDQTTFQGKTFYFCSKTCKQQFDQNPQRYAAQQAAKR